VPFDLSSVLFVATANKTAWRGVAWRGVAWRGGSETVDWRVG